MKLSEILPRNFVIAEVAAGNKEVVLREMCRFLTRQGAIADADALHRSLMEREHFGSTGIGENVAVPHAKSGQSGQMLCVFARSVDGIDFDSLDHKPVNFICLLVAPADSVGQHLKALARIARLLKNQDLRDSILKAKDADDIYTLLTEEDSKFI
jgi:PTS system nitrogen regulatory IIA component